MNTEQHPALITERDELPSLTLILPSGLGKGPLWAAIVTADGPRPATGRHRPDKRALPAGGDTWLESAWAAAVCPSVVSEYLMCGGPPLPWPARSRRDSGGSGRLLAQRALVSLLAMG